MSSFPFCKTLNPLLIMEKKIEDLVQKIREKYEQDGEDPATYLEGLLYQNYITYWDYIQTDVLLNIQKPVTSYPDEMVFILYHQITELYFKMVLWECKQLREADDPSVDFFIARLTRIENYFKQLIQSFGIMRGGMDPKEFLKFRLALTPASGFQSVQFRYIELAMTPLENLVDFNKREEMSNKPPEEQYQEIYWKKGATEVDTGNKAMVLRNFEEKYDEELLETAKKWQGKTIWELYEKLAGEKKQDEKLKQALRNVDKAINVKWGQVHYKTAKRYLESDEGQATEATGGTNWKSYMPPANQKVFFFPELWSEKEQDQWGD